MRARILLAVGLLVLAVGCSEEEGEKNAGRSCEGLLESADPAAALPADLPGADGQVVYEKAKQGSTDVWFAYVQGSDVVAVRDAVKAELEAAGGYTGLEADAEPPAEAELEFEGKHEGSVQVIPLCQGYLRIRYRVG